MTPTEEFAQLWQPDIAGIELFNAQLFRHTFSKHFHETYTIGMNDGGQGCFWYQGETHEAHPGCFNLINPGAVHTGQPASSTGWNFRNLYISVPLIEQLLTQLELKPCGLPYFRHPTVWDPPLQRIFHQLFHALCQPTTPLEQQSLLLEAFSHLFCRHTDMPYHPRSPQPESPAIALVRDYLEAHYAEPVSIEELAQLANLSPYYLIRSFHQQMGLPPHSYQRHWQLLHAKRSLRTAKPLSDIAVENGFYDQSHLNRTFKRAFGITPGQYQKSNFVQSC